MSTLKIMGGNGFHLTTPNGWTLSVQIGGGTYSANHDEPIRSHSQVWGLPSRTAEIAAWHGPKGKLIEWDCDTVAGYVPIRDVVFFIGFLNTLPDDSVEGARILKENYLRLEVDHDFD